MFSVFIEGCGTNALQLASSKCWLKDVGGVDGTLSGTRTNQGMDFIDHQDHISGGFDLLHDLFEALLKFTPVLRTGNQQANIQSEHPLVFQDVWDIPLLNALGQALRDCGFTHPRFTD